MKKFFRKWFSPKAKPYYTTIIYVESLVDVPKEPEKTIFIVAEGTKYKWVVFECPNKCGNRVEVNLMRSRSPYWTIKIKKNKISLYPSIVVQGCGAHFWLEENIVHEAKFLYEE